MKLLDKLFPVKQVKVKYADDDATSKIKDISIETRIRKSEEYNDDSDSGSVTGGDDRAPGLITEGEQNIQNTTKVFMESFCTHKESSELSQDGCSNKIFKIEEAFAELRTKAHFLDLPN